MRTLITYVCDVGSVAKERFAWARVAQSEEIICEKDIGMLCSLLNKDLASKNNRISIGMECPGTIEIPADLLRLGRSRAVDKGPNSSMCSIGMSAGFLGIQQLAFILSKVNRCGRRPTFDWEAWSKENAGDDVLFWEAFVSGEDKPGGESPHIADAQVSAQSFQACAAVQKLPRNSVQPEQSMLCLTGCCLLWAGWTDNIAFLRGKPIVVTPGAARVATR